jgi:hypothetical protein
MSGRAVIVWSLDEHRGQPPAEMVAFYSQLLDHLDQVEGIHKTTVKTVGFAPFDWLQNPALVQALGAIEVELRGIQEHLPDESPRELKSFLSMELRNDVTCSAVVMVSSLVDVIQYIDRLAIVQPRLGIPAGPYPAPQLRRIVIVHGNPPDSSVTKAFRAVANPAIHFQEIGRAQRPQPLPGGMAMPFRIPLPDPDHGAGGFAPALHEPGSHVVEGVRVRGWLKDLRRDKFNLHYGLFGLRDGRDNIFFHSNDVIEGSPMEGAEATAELVKNPHPKRPDQLKCVRVRITPPTEIKLHFGILGERRKDKIGGDFFFVFPETPDQPGKVLEGVRQGTYAPLNEFVDLLPSGSSTTANPGAVAALPPTIFPMSFPGSVPGVYPQSANPAVPRQPQQGDRVCYVEASTQKGVKATAIRYAAGLPGRLMVQISLNAGTSLWIVIDGPIGELLRENNRVPTAWSEIDNSIQLFIQHQYQQLQQAALHYQQQQQQQQVLSAQQLPEFPVYFDLAQGARQTDGEYRAIRVRRRN